MNKILFIVLIVIVGGVFAFNHFSSSSSEEDESSVSSREPAYSTLNMKLTSGSRDFNLKAVMEFPSQKACEKSRESYSALVQDFKGMCEGTAGCQAMDETACSSYVEDKYLTMLNKEPRDIYYLHMQGAKKERGVIVFWGLNDTEGQQICEKGQEDIVQRNRYKSNADDRVDVACVAPN